MFEVNCLSGDKRKVVKAKMTVELSFLVGGADDADREDSIREALEDHYDETVRESFWRDAITGLTIDEVKVVGKDEDNH